MLNKFKLLSISVLLALITSVLVACGDNPTPAASGGCDWASGAVSGDFYYYTGLDTTIRGGLLPDITIEHINAADPDHPELISTFRASPGENTDAPAKYAFDNLPGNNQGGGGVYQDWYQITAGFDDDIDGVTMQDYSASFTLDNCQIKPVSGVILGEGVKLPEKPPAAPAQAANNNDQQFSAADALLLIYMINDPWFYGYSYSPHLDLYTYHTYGFYSYDYGYYPPAPSTHKYTTNNYVTQKVTYNQTTVVVNNGKKTTVVKPVAPDKSVPVKADVKAKAPPKPTTVAAANGVKTTPTPLKSNNTAPIPTPRPTVAGAKTTVKVAAQPTAKPAATAKPAPAKTSAPSKPKK